MERTASGHEADTSTVPADGYKFNSPMDKEHIKLQRQAIWDMLRHLGSHILSQGINLTNISLPVQVFEPRSFLERITDSWAYLDLIEAAANAPDAVERLKYVAGFVIGGLRRQTSTLKPFNPILGETYQVCLAPLHAPNILTYMHMHGKSHAMVRCSLEFDAQFLAAHESRAASEVLDAYQCSLVHSHAG